MPQGFLAQVAGELYRQWGDGVSSLWLLFPSRRAQLFFCEALAARAGHPIWQPHTISIDELMEGISGRRTADSVRLVTELYKVWSRYHEESFDEFYYWGRMLLSDFDSLDKYLIDAPMLLRNLGELHALDDDSYLTPGQREAIRSFWENFSRREGISDEQKAFLKVWNTLSDIYKDFNAALGARELAYTGMMHRAAVERLDGEGLPAEFASRRYAVIGFNALTECEKSLFGHLQKEGVAQFFWDCDRYYLDEQAQEAGLFMRENLRRFPQSAQLPGGYENFSKPKQITVVSAPSDTLQCKYMHEVLASIPAPDKRTAVVLADEELLGEVLYSLPENVETLNVTMGYPLRATPAYSFTERLLEMQRRLRMDGDKARFYHSDAVGLLRHPFLLEEADTAPLVKRITDRRMVYPPSTLFEGGGLMRAVFTPCGDWRALGAYLIDVLSRVAVARPVDAEPMRTEYLAATADHVRKLCNSLEECGVDMSIKTFAALLRAQLQGVRVPYEGEPLQGVQVMGFLETRALDFDNVIILSTADDRLPGLVSPSASFIPYNLRAAYGLPTPAHHEAMYAYYFYRLLQRAQRVDLVYCSRTDESRRGEPSRYVWQLDYESPHRPAYREVALDANLSRTEPLTVEKDAAVMERLGEFLSPDGHRLSPTAFFAYVVCPMRFYYRSVARLEVENQIEEQVDARLMGNILHKAMELLYKPLKGTVYTPQQLAALDIDTAVQQAIADSFPDARDPRSMGGGMQLAAHVVRRYISRGIIPYDAAQQGVAFTSLEEKLGCDFTFESGGERRTVRFFGLADRIDSLPGGMSRIVDYKTGRIGATSLVMEFDGVASLFRGEKRGAAGAAVQTLLYGMMHRYATGRDSQPAIYAVRHIHEPGYSPLFTDHAAGRAVERYSDYAVEFEVELSRTLGGIFDPATPFTQCEDENQCIYCDFKGICRRGD